MRIKTIVSLILLVFIMVSAWGFTTIYITARGHYLEGHDKSKVLAIEEGNLTAVHDIETYIGDVIYHIVSGINSNNQEVYVWVPQNNEKQKLTIKKRSAGITKKQALDIVRQEYKPVEIVSIKLGMDEEIPIWEVKYKDASNRLSFDFIHFSNGDILKHMAIKMDQTPQ